MKNIFGGLINKNYGWEVSLFNKIRELSDGITFFEFELEINWDRHLVDHSPKGKIFLIILNYVIIEIGVYNIHHKNMG